MATQKKSISNGSLGSYRMGQSASPKYVYPHKDKNGNANVPTGKYSAVIDKIVKSTTNSGADSLDVYYTLTDKNSAKHYAKQRIPKNTNLMEDFLDFLVNVGININKTKPEDISGDVGTVYVTYPDDTDCFGQVVYSKPIVINHNPKKVSSMKELLDGDDADEDEGESDDLDDEDLTDFIEEDSEE